VTESSAESLAATLLRWGHFEECLLHDVRPVMFGYGLDVVFNLVRVGDRVRENVLDSPMLLTLRLLGVDSVNFVGGLTLSMKAAPEQINWGLSEVSRVEQTRTSSDLGISVRWEGARRLDIVFVSFEVRAKSR
jgi:hypothetical protein